jgi:hypothetical protein
MKNKRKIRREFFRFYSLYNSHVFDLNLAEWGKTVTFAVISAAWSFATYSHCSGKNALHLGDTITRYHSDFQRTNIRVYHIIFLSAKDSKGKTSPSIYLVQNPVTPQSRIRVKFESQKRIFPKCSQELGAHQWRTLLRGENDSMLQKCAPKQTKNAKGLPSFLLRWRRDERRLVKCKECNMF